MTEKLLQSEQRVSQPVRQLVSSATDEQLAWMVGPDRRFYSTEAVRAATRELKVRREDRGDSDEQTSFNFKAFIFGPFWYFYHYLFGRGLLVLALLLAALLGLRPIAEAVGIPPLIWALAVYVGVGAYCSRFADRDLAESQTQKRSLQRKSLSRSPQTSQKKSSALVRAAEVGCPAAGEQARALLLAKGIPAVVASASDDGPRKPSSQDGPVRVLVAETDLGRAKELLADLLAMIRDDPESICPEESPSEASSE